MKIALLSVLVCCLALSGRAAAGEFIEDWKDDSPGADGAGLSAWTLANGSASSIKVVEAGNARALVIGADTFAHLRSTSSIPAGEKLVLTGRVRLDPAQARAGVGLGVRSEKLGPPVGYEVRINPTLSQIFLFRVDGEQEKQLLARPFPADKDPHVIKLTLDRSGSGLEFILLVDDDAVGSGTDANPLDLGSNVRPYLTSRGGTEIAYEMIELSAP